MKYLFALPILIIALAIPASAQTGPQFIAGFSSIHSNSDFSFPAGDVTFHSIDLRDASGFNAGVVIPFSQRFAVELSGASASTPARIAGLPGTVFQGSRLATNDVRLTPLAVALEARFAPDRMFDPYITGGAAYLMAGDITGDLQEVFARRIEIGNDLGWVAGAGIDIHSQSHLGFRIDARRESFSPTLRLVALDGPSMEGKGKIEPTIVSADVTWRF